MRRADLARLAWRERAFWRGAWVWSVSNDGNSVTVVSAGQRKRKYILGLPQPVSLAVRNQRLRSLLSRRFARKFAELRRNAATVVAARKFAVDVGGNRWALHGFHRAVLVSLVLSPSSAPRMVLRVAKKRGNWRKSALVVRRILNAR